MSFQQGLSGLNATSKNLEVIGNNIANSNTFGAKSARAEFADMYAAAGGGGANAVGIGVNLASVSQQFTQGNIVTTENSLDLAINGAGFFQVTDGENPTQYTRNGQFKVNREGFVVNNQGQRLMGYPADGTGTIRPGAAAALQLPTAGITPAATTKVRMELNLEAGAAVTQPAVVAQRRADDAAAAVVTANAAAAAAATAATAAAAAAAAAPGDPVLAAASAAAAAAQTAADAAAATALANSTAAAAAATAAAAGPQFDPDDPKTYNKATSLTAYDTKGQPVAVTYYFQKTGVDQWDVYASANGQVLAGTTAAPLPISVTFPSNGGRPTQPAVIDEIPLVIPANALSGIPSEDLDITIDMSGATQYGSKFAVTDLSQDGYAPGQLVGLQFESNGIVTARYSNGQSKPAGQVEIATFRNIQGLRPTGGNSWDRSYASGDPIVGVPGEGNLGAIQAGALEESNIDLTAELVNMMTAQRVYQANAQTIKTQDQVLQTLVNLR